MIAEKQCLKCGIVKPVDCFSPDRRRSDRHQGQCKECRARDEATRREQAPPEVRLVQAQKRAEHYARNRRDQRAYQTEWKRKNKDRVKGYALKKRYGITREDVDRMLAEQDSRCAICRRPFPLKRLPHTDHDHATGLVRGLLCGGCNIALGFLEKDGWLDAARAYLRFHSTRQIGPRSA